MSRCTSHSSQETYVRCSRCEKYICIDCMRPASIGYQCPECASDSTPVIRGFSKKFLSISLITIYVAQLVLGDILISNFALFAPSVSAGQLWRLLTAGFLHGSILHLLFNVYILWVLGSQLESILGKTKFILIFHI